MPHIRFLFVRLAVCYRLPSSIRCLLDSAELLVLPATGRTVDFHHTITRALPGAPKKEGSRDLLILESPKRKNLKNAVLSGWSPLPHQTVGCQRIKRFSTSVTMRSRISAQAVSTKMPAITVFMSKVVSACRIR